MEGKITGGREELPAGKELHLIPFNKPVWLGTEPARVTQAILENGHVACGGPFGDRCEALLARHFGQPALLTSSCTHALEMAALLLGIGPGDAVVVPSFTFVSTANAFALRGAELLLVDVDENGNIDLDEVEAALSSRTRAVVAVHYAGNSCDLTRLLELCGTVPVVEDAAQAFGASFAGRPLGMFGVLGTISFHETKNVGCGEGGALTVRSAELLGAAREIRDKGTNRHRFLAGEVDEYTWTRLGSNYGLSDLNAAYLLGQLEAHALISARRRELYESYLDTLSGPLERVGGYVVRGRPGSTPNHHIFAMVLRSPKQRDEFIARMRQHGIVTPFHYVALHLSPMGRRFHDSRRSLCNSERLSSCLVRLPLFYNLSDHDQEQVITRAREILDAF
jgi:dTDP-4-amino-4,6-dideoxygalactose transaminase